MFEVETKHWWFQAKKDILIHLIKDKILPNFSKTTISIVDIGCGTGLLTNYYIDYFYRIFFYK